MDIRYHLTSLIGVFLALGIGILIGTQLGQSGVVENEQLRLAQRLEASLEGLRAENRDLQASVTDLDRDLARERDFVDVMLGAVVAGTLAGTQVEVYVPPGQAAAAERVQRVLEQAGAQARVHERVPPAVPESLDAAVVVLWPEPWEGDGWPAALPQGAVLAVPSAVTDSRPASGAAAEAADLVEVVDTPWGLLALVERLRTGQAPADAKALLRERLGP